MFEDTYVLNLGVVIALAMAGITLGVYAVFRGSRVLGIASLILNSGVATLYGFLAVFFGLGGTR